MRKSTILIIEDEKSISNALKAKLEKSGYDVFQAFNGEAGLQEALANKPDLILLDIVMPKMDGLTMLKQLRSDSWGQEVPIMILTNLSDAKKIEEASSQGVYDFLVKADWKIEDVLSKIENYIK